MSKTKNKKQKERINILIAIAWEEDKSAFINNHNQNNEMSVHSPILTAVKSSNFSFDSICVINTNSKVFDQKDDFISTKPKATFESYIKWLHVQVGDRLKIKPYYFESNDNGKITDYAFLHDQLRHHMLKKITEDAKKLKADINWYILINSGPSETLLIWLLLSRQLKAIPLKSNNSGEIVAANIPFDVFYNTKPGNESSPVGNTHPYLLTFHCEKMKKAAQYAMNVAPLPHSVLIQGPHGTGKEMMARLIHDKSGNLGAFIAVNCSSFTESLIGAELFGTIKGSFTDAIDQPGMFEQAHNGTLFLDEIGDMPLSQQAKLLRVLQTKEVRRIHSDEVITVNFRLISATNKDLAKEVEEQRFREDLYYRINVLSIDLPPLHERGLKDIKSIAKLHVEIAEQELKNSNKVDNHPIIIPDNQHMKLSKEAMDILVKHSWPGNARELASVIKRAATHCVVFRGADDYVIREEDIKNSLNVIPIYFQTSGFPSIKANIDTTKTVKIDKILSEVELEYCNAYLKETGRIWKRTYEKLGYQSAQTMKNRFESASEKLKALSKE